MYRILILSLLLIVVSASAFAIDSSSDATLRPASGAPTVSLSSISEVPLNRPNMDTPALVSWVAITVSDAMTFSSDNYRERIPKSARNFTKQGWEIFASVLQRRGVLDAVTAHKSDVTAEPKMSPILVQEELHEGKWRYIVNMPVLIDYTNGENHHKDTIQAALVIERVAVSENPVGLAIAQFIDHEAPRADLAPTNLGDLFDKWPGPPATETVSRPQPDAPLEQPNVDDAGLIAWAGAVATQAATFGFTNRERVFARAQEDFTPEGWEEFEGALTDVGLLKNMAQYSQIFTSAPMSKPVIVHKGLVDGRYQWTVKLTLVQTNRASCEKVITHVPATLTIVRAPAARSPLGIAINHWDGANRFTFFSSKPNCSTEIHDPNY